MWPTPRGAQRRAAHLPARHLRGGKPGDQRIDGARRGERIVVEAPGEQMLLADIRALQPTLFDAVDAPATPSAPAHDVGDPLPLLPVILQRDGATISLFTTLTTLGTPRDAGLQEMRIECFYPADEASRLALERIAL